MVYIFLGSVIVLFLFFLLFPFNVIVHNEDNYLYINVGKLINFKINLFAFFDKKNNKKNETELNKIKKFKFKKINLKIQGLNFDYQLNGAYFGLLYALFGFLFQVARMNNIDFNYDLRYQGDRSIEFKSIFRAKMITVIDMFNGV